MRHHWNPSQIAILKRGFILTLALFLFVAVFKPVKVNAAEQSEIRVSYINFSTEVDINTDTGNYEHNKNDWVIIDFNLNGYYTGTINYYCTLSTSALIPDVTCVGAYYEVTSSRESSGSTYQQTDTYTFTIENCQHFQLIYHASTSGLGVYFNGVHSLTDADVTASDGSSSGSVSVDYTAILEGISYDITEIYSYMDQIAQDSAGIASNVALIYQALQEGLTTLEDIYNLQFANSIPEYSRTLYFWLRNTGFTIYQDGSLATYFNWCLKKPTSYSSGAYLYLQKNSEYSIVIYNNVLGASSLTLTSYSDSTVYQTINLKRTDSNAQNYVLKTADFTWGNASGWVYISEFTNCSYVYPVYFGLADSMPTTVHELIGDASEYSLIQRIIDLFTENNSQNDEMIGKLDEVTENQETINQSIEDFNSDFNTAMEDIPISETTSQLQQMQSTFTYTNDLISQLWNALGRIQLVIIVALIIALIQIFRGKKT